MDSSRELAQATTLSARIREAADLVLVDQPVLSGIHQACLEYEQRSRDILLGRGLPSLTIAAIGGKGQGKSWVLRQWILDQRIRQQLPSGVLAHEATAELYWIGPTPPLELDRHCEKFIHCPEPALLDLSTPYLLLDMPGITDANPRAAELAHQALSMTPIQLLVIRRDQLRSSVTSPLVNRSDGVLCVPIINGISPREYRLDPPRPEASDQPPGLPPDLAADLESWLRMLRESAPLTKVLPPILLEDFEATGDEAMAGERLRYELARRLRHPSLSALSQTKERRLAAIAGRLRHQVHRLITEQTPQLALAVQRFTAEADRLPTQVIESVLGSPLVLETAVRARLRTQLVNDTSPLWFPYRTTLSLLALTQGAWDRLLLAMTGSLPSLFGTLVTWARNMHQARQASWEVQQGLHQRLQRQVHEQLNPRLEQFHRTLAHLPASSHGQPKVTSSSVQLYGSEELQSRCQELFEQFAARHRSPRWLLTIPALIGSMLFWSLMLGPIVSIYRQYFIACYDALIQRQAVLDAFPHPSPTLLLTSGLLSFLPLLLFAMIVLATFLHRAKLHRLSQRLLDEHHSLVEELRRAGILRIAVNDPWLEKAQFLANLEPAPSTGSTEP
jgi:hypothetical protein